jgi:glutathione reductase (NADPH)
MMTDSTTVDLAVIGGGSAGLRCSRVAASLGASVVLFERSLLGGTCVNLGCVPKKLLGYGAHVAHELDEARGMGWSIGEASLDWKALVANKDRAIAEVNASYDTMLGSAGVKIVRAHATVRKGATLEVIADGHVTRARRVVVATGGAPTRPPIPGVEHAWVSDDFFHWPSLPRSIVIVGGGYVGLEIASMLAALGVEVQLVARRSVLSTFDPDVQRVVAREVQKHGVRVIEHRGELRSIDRSATGMAVHFADGAPVRAESVLLAIGRTPTLAGLEALELRTTNGAIAVDDRFATSVPGVFAIGDVIGRSELTPVALAEGMLLARMLFASGGPPVPYALVPTAVFSMPPVASVGLTEPEARARGEVTIFRTEFRPMKHMISGSTERTMMKLVVDAKTDRVLGVHVVGLDAPEMIQGFAVALTAGATKAQLDATIGVHPTAAEELVTLRTPVV